MEQMNYWRIQGKKVLFPEIDMEKPERKQLAGRLLIIGGNKGSFFTVANAAAKAHELGIGEVKVLLPDSLKKQVPASPDVIFAPGESSGGFGKEAIKFAAAAAENTDFVLMIGDMGKNSETATFAERFMWENSRPILVTRDAIELLATSANDWLGCDGVAVCAALPQLQKIFKAVYYPKIITLSMPTNQLIETLHKFTITYPMMVVTYHNGQVVVAKGGEVVTTELGDTKYNPISIWAGELVVKMTALMLWNEKKDFAAATSAILM
ncbi:hypothetical protein FWF89_00075 [Candidatus Saccharibacteria bacterium]|nr:hypothetical protein [Candidatus Saccharibacteria bacterium]